MTFVPNAYACSLHTVYYGSSIMFYLYTGGAKVCKFTGTAAQKGTDILS